LDFALHGVGFRFADNWRVVTLFAEVRLRLESNEWLLLDQPMTILEATTPGEVVHVLREVERLSSEEGCHLAGFVTYEAGAAFGLRTRYPQLRLVPLAWFAAFLPTETRRVSSVSGEGDYCLGPLVQDWTRDDFAEAFERIKAHLLAGDTYQVNQTFGVTATFSGDSSAFFADLVRRQPVDGAAFFRTTDWSICSVSPELFFTRRGAEIAMKPMKGTAPRGRTLQEDSRQQARLQASPKERAENVMIVDMVRNDLGRIAEWGTVEVPALFTAERYPSIWQLTSTVTGRSEAALDQLFGALHPSASVTGAPKVRTMEIIESIEPRPRGVYTGAIGYVAPDGTARFNVAIRTAVVDHARHTVHYGVGSGVVWDSELDREYNECLLKASILVTSDQEDFELLETLVWSPDKGFALRERHLARLEASATYFGFRHDRREVVQTMDAAVSGATDRRRVRVLMGRDGVRVEHTAFVPSRRPLRAALATDGVDSHDVFLFHKTTRRGVYDRALVPGVDDVVLWNERGEITETTRCNVVIECGGDRLTPALDCGLLAGTFRAELLEQAQIREAIVTIGMLRAAGWCWLINSLHGWRRAELVEIGS
jgi:para-aminobenzoate synthetase/4-amino-4-deoxychorismate lyase